MQASPPVHPSHDDLLAFAHGRLSGPRFAELEEHLSACDACCDWIAQQPEHTLVALAREVATQGFRDRAETPAVLGDEPPAALVNHPRYRVLERIASGGMGAVYRAEHRLMQRIVALKIVRPDLLASPGAVERFHREVRLAARLAHPNIVVSHDAEQAGDLHLLVMEHVAGASLDETIAASGPASVAQACDWIRQAALGLQHAHEQGMVHRDIKPHNLMLTGAGQVKILDFGLTRLVAEQASGIGHPAGRPADRTQSGMILGTPDYIAPEQIGDSHAADIRSDIYSLGCTLYFTLTGQAPFAGLPLREVLAAHTSRARPDVRTVRPEAPDRLAEILARMTAKRPAERYQTPLEVAEALEQVQREAIRSEAAAEGVPDGGAASGGASLADRLSHGQVAAIVSIVLLLAGAVSLAKYFLPASAPRQVRLLAMLPSRGLWYPDYRGLVDAAAATKTEIVFASPSGQPSEILFTSPPGVAVPDVRLSSATSPEGFDGIVFLGYETGEFLPGGSAGEEVRRLLVEFQRQKKVVAALCAGTRILAQQGALRGKRAAPSASVKSDEITFEGGTLGPGPVETDGLTVTASEASDAPAFLEAILKLVPR